MKVITSGSPSEFFVFEYQAPWKGFLNTGYSFNRTLWEVLQSHQMTLDVSADWDWSIWSAMREHTPKLFDVFSLVPSVSRIFNIGTCGLHFHNPKCDEWQTKVRSKRDFETKPRKVKVRSNAGRLICSGPSCFGNVQIDLTS